VRLTANAKCTSISLSFFYPFLYFGCGKLASNLNKHEP
jgi:hypothetical protein